MGCQQGTISITNRMKFALGKKLGMTTIYDETGAQNVTLIAIGAHHVDLLRTADKDGYSAVRVAVPQTAKKTCRKEFRVDDTSAYTQDTAITAETFAVGDVVRVSGVTKAKGFQGVVKRHGFGGGPKTHGHRHVLRQAGSIGSAFPEHVMKGKRMAGRMGGTRATSRGLRVVQVDAQAGTIAVKGSVPGVAGRIVEDVSLA